MKRKEQRDSSVLSYPRSRFLPFVNFVTVVKIVVFGLGKEKREKRVRPCVGNVSSSLRVRLVRDACVNGSSGLMIVVVCGA